MVNLNNNEVETLNKFFQNFLPSAIKILSGTLDKEVYKKFDFVVESSSFIEDFDALKESNILYKLDYAKGASPRDLALLIPEEFIASVTDVLMGGKGEDSYKGSLSELEINASSDLFRRIFKDIESSYKHLYNEELAFNAKAVFLLKEMPEYEEEFDKMDFDYVINNVLRINNEKEYTIKLLTKTQNLKQTLSSLRLMLGNNLSKGIDIDSIGIEQLSDVEINITAELGRAQVPMKYALELVRGSIVELDTVNNSDIKVFANGVEVARAQVVVLEDNFGLRITKIISPEERLKSI